MKLIGKALDENNFIGVEFGRTQANFSFSKNGRLARELKVKPEDIIELDIKVRRKK